MKKKYVLWTAAVFAAAFSLSAATAMGKKPPSDESTLSSAGATSIAVEVLFRQQQCNLQQAQTRWIDSADAYRTLFQELNKSYLGGDAQQPPAVDFSQHGVILVAMGQKNTGGYVVDVANQPALLEGDVLKVSVQWREPKKGMMVTQVLTSPCMLLKIPVAPFGRIEIKDQNGTLRLSASRE
ncbi:MAG: hypothetical protein AMJ53_12645 [Gammaproteobacteria bacterium SG8_11]|nr:MAG: hypothetical protein AMJ53_12645 [Gammaproteobacteria bacterium SG8_11]